MRGSALAAGAWLLARLLVSRRGAGALTAATVCALAAVAVTAAATYLVRTVWALFPDRLEPNVYAWTGTGLFAVFVAAAGLTTDRNRWHGAISVAAATVVVAACANQVNVSFDAYPTLRDALGIERPNEIPFSDITQRVRVMPDIEPVEASWSPPPGLPPRGKLTSAPIPGLSSHFVAREAELYLPPAYFADPRP